MNYLPIAFFVLGFILILVEVFVPGFGVFGITGVLCVLIGIYIFEDDPQKAIIEMALVILAMAIVVPIFVRVMKKRRGFRKLGLQQSLTTEEGFTSRKKNLEQYLGAQGVALTDLRPAGTMVLEGDVRLDVVTRGDYISKDSCLEVVGIDGTWLVVRHIEDI